MYSTVIYQELFVHIFYRFIVYFPMGLDFLFRSVNDEYWSRILRPDAIPDINHMRGI